MPDIQIRASVPLDPNAAFDAYVGQMNAWWPRQGVFPYSFAPQSTFPRHIRLEAKVGGRYYETFADETEFVIGRVTDYQPPRGLSYTWRDPNWQGETQIKLAISASEEGSRVVYEQHGFKAAGVAWLIPYYQIGCEQTFAGYIAHCRAMHQLQSSGLAWD